MTIPIHGQNRQRKPAKWRERGDGDANDGRGDGQCASRSNEDGQSYPHRRQTQPDEHDPRGRPPSQEPPAHGRPERSYRYARLENDHARRQPRGDGEKSRRGVRITVKPGCSAGQSGDKQHAPENRALEDPAPACEYKWKEIAELSPRNSGQQDKSRSHDCETSPASELSEENSRQLSGVVQVSRDKNPEARPDDDDHPRQEPAHESHLKLGYHQAAA